MNAEHGNPEQMNSVQMNSVQVPDLDGVGAVLFDLDGTLINSEPVHRAAWRSFFDSRGWQVSDHTYVTQFVGRRGSDAFRSTDGPWRTEDPDALLAEVLTHLDAVTAQPGIVPGAAELIRRVHGQGVPVAVVTSALRPWVNEALELLGVSDVISVVVSGDDVAVGKPDPDCYLTACTRLGVDPADAVAFEDSTSGVAAASAAGIARIIAVLTTTDADALREAGAHHLVDDLGGFPGSPGMSH